MCISTSLLTLRVHVLGQFESVRISQVSVGGSDSQDQAALPGDELHYHVPDLLLDVCGLVPHRHLGDTRQVNESQVEHCNSGGGGRCQRGGQKPCLSEVLSGRFYSNHVFSADMAPLVLSGGEETF